MQAENYLSLIILIPIVLIILFLTIINTVQL